MASIVSQQQGSWRHLSSVAISTGAVPGGDSIDMREFSQGVIYASSTHGVPVLTFWTAPSTTGVFRLAKTSTGGAVSVTIIANSAIKFPAAASSLQFIKLSSSTTAAVKALPNVFLKK